MAIEHGNISVNLGSNKQKDPSRKPTIGSGRRRIELLKQQTFDTLSSIKSIIMTSYSINEAGYYRFVFENYVYDNDGNPTYGFLDLENENELKINGVLQENLGYEVTQSGNDIIVDLIEDLGFDIVDSDRIIFRARIKEIL